MSTSYRTRVKVGLSRPEMQRMFPDMTTAIHVTLFVDGDIVWREDNPSHDLRNLFSRLRRAMPSRISYVQTTIPKQYDSFVCVEGQDYWIQENGEGGSFLEVTTWSEDEQKHYDHVDRLRNSLAKFNVPIASAECEITVIRRCE